MRSLKFSMRTFFRLLKKCFGFGSFNYCSGSKGNCFDAKGGNKDKEKEDRYTSLLVHFVKYTLNSRSRQRMFEKYNVNSSVELLNRAV